MARTRRIVEESINSESDGGVPAGKTVRASGPARKAVTVVRSGAKSKQTTRSSTGGKAPLRALERAAARVMAGVGEHLVQVKWAPDTSKDARDLPSLVKLAGAESSPPSRADLGKWSVSVKGFLVAFRGTRCLDATPWVAIDRLYAMCADTPLEGDTSAPELGAVVAAHPSDAPVRTLLAHRKGVDAAGTARDAIHFQARGAEGESEWHVNLLASRFNVYTGSGGVLSFSMCTAQIPARKLYDGPLHAVALDLYGEVEFLENKLKTHPDAWRGTYLSVSIESFLGDRPYLAGSQTGDMMFQPAYALKYTRELYRLNCMVGSLLLALESVDVLQAGYLHRYLLDGDYRPTYTRLRRMNRFLHEMDRAHIPHWNGWRLESVLPPALAVTPGDPAARLAWLNEHVVSDPLLIVLYDAQGCQRHVVAIVKHQGQKAVLDPFERFAMKYSDLALAVSAGNPVVTGLGEVYKLVSYPSGPVVPVAAGATGVEGGVVAAVGIQASKVVSPTGGGTAGAVAEPSVVELSRKRTAKERRKAKKARKKARKAAAAAAAASDAVQDVVAGFGDVHEVLLILGVI